MCLTMSLTQMTAPQPAELTWSRLKRRPRCIEGPEIAN